MPRRVCVFLDQYIVIADRLYHTAGDQLVGVVHRSGKLARRALPVR